jgi:hypothetical protein
VTRSVTVFLWAAFAVMTVAVIISTSVILFGLHHVGIFSSSGEFLYDNVNSISALSTAISTIFALIVGTLAILVVISNERAETKTVEQLKIDISSLWMTLHNLRNRAILYTSPDLVDDSKDLFENERRRLTEIITGSTGFALYLWQATIIDKDQQETTIDVAGLINLTTLALRKSSDRVPIFNAIAHRAYQASSRLASVGDPDIRRMARFLARLGKGLDQAKNAAEKDKLSAFLKDWRQREDDELSMPTEDFVERVLTRARQKIGGKADETMMHFLSKARSGDRGALRNFYQLVEKLDLVS